MGSISSQILLYLTNNPCGEYVFCYSAESNSAIHSNYSTELGLGSNLNGHSCHGEGS